MKSIRYYLLEIKINYNHFCFVQAATRFMIILKSDICDLIKAGGELVIWKSILYYHFPFVTSSNFPVKNVSKGII